jgi:hypothetical protein
MVYTVFSATFNKTATSGKVRIGSDMDLLLPEMCKMKLPDFASLY